MSDPASSTSPMLNTSPLPVTQPIVTAASVPTPKRGGVHPIYGVFLGGGPMNDQYCIDSPDFHCVSQLRSVKQLQIIQTQLEQARDSISSIKFHGNLDIDESKTVTELDKTHFIKKAERSRFLLHENYRWQDGFAVVSCPPVHSQRSNC